MSIRPTFAGFYTARSGIVASQANLDVTGQNLTNILTNGYTRQRADLFSVGDSGYKSRIANPNDIHIGLGVSVNSTSQLRDPGYDIRYRQENTKFGYEETKLSGLEDVKKIFDEIMKGDGLHGQLGEMIGALEDVMKNASDKDANRIVKNQTDLVTHLLNESSKALETLKEQQVNDFQITVDKVNTTLDKISSLNKLIMEDAKYNNPSHELKDQRNVLLDELSGYMKIDYSYNPKNLDELSVNFLTEDGDKIPLVQGNKAVAVELHNKGDLDTNGDPLKAPHIVFTPPTVDSDGVTLKGNDKMKMPDGTPMDATAVEAEDCNTGALGAYFDVLTGEGDFGGAADLNNRGIPYYEKMLDTFARTFAEQMNDLNRGKVSVSADGTLSFGDLKGVTEKDQIGKADIPKLTDANGKTLKWIKEMKAAVPPATDPTPVYMEDADWKNMTDAKIRDIMKLPENKKLVTDAGGTLKGTYGDVKLGDNGIFTYLPKPGGGDVSYTLTPERVKGLVNAEGKPIAWIKGIDDSTTPPTEIPMADADWENMTQDQLKEMLQLPENQKLIKDEGAYLYGQEKQLFVASDKTGVIDAGNIKISNEWIANDNLLTHSIKDKAQDGDNDNISRFLAMFNSSKIAFTDHGTTAYTGSMETCISNMQVTLGLDVSKTATLNSGYRTNLIAIDNNRASVSGVDENEETSNMMMYQKAFSASSRIMTTMDEMLDTLINRTGMVGR